MPRTISSEIINTVAFFVNADPQTDEARLTLVACMLVSRAFCTVVKPLLFEKTTVRVHPDGESQMQLQSFAKCGLPLKTKRYASTTGIVQHVRSLELVLNLHGRGESKEMDKNISAALKLFTSTHGRVESFTLRGSSENGRRMSWNLLAQASRGMLQKLIAKPQLRTLRLEFIKSVPASLFKGTKLKELYLDTIICDTVPAEGEEDEDDEDDEDEEEDEEDEEGEEDGKRVPSPHAKALASLPLSSLQEVGFKLNSKKDVVQADALVGLATRLRSVAFICGPTFHFNTPLNWDNYTTLQSITFGNEEPEDDVLTALLSCVNSALEAIGDESEESIPVPNVVFKATYADGGAYRSRGVCRGDYGAKPNPKVLDAVLSGHLFADVETLTFEVLVQPCGKREPSEEWRDEVEAQAISFYNLPKTYRTAKDISADVKFVYVDED